MKRFNSHVLGADQGEVLLFSDFEDGGEMWAGDGPREKRKAVRFSDRFARRPLVQVGLSMWDMSKDTNARADLRAEAITEEGFDIVFRTWGDTRMARLRVMWSALGPLHDDDIWDVD